MAAPWRASAHRIRISPLNVPMLPDSFRKALFGLNAKAAKIGGDDVAARNVEMAKQHLTQHNLNLPAEVSDVIHQLFAKVRLPKLVGKNISEHFGAIGSYIAVC